MHPRFVGYRIVSDVLLFSNDVSKVVIASPDVTSGRDNLITHKSATIQGCT